MIRALACSWRLASIRLPMKPWHTPETTGTLRIVVASCITVASWLAPVFAPRTTSSSFITLAGEKKCIPSTASGRAVTDAISFTSR